MLLRAAGLARSTFYYQLKVLNRPDKHAGLKAGIHAVYQRHKGRYGYRRIASALKATKDSASPNTVQRVMQQLGLKSVVRRKKYQAYRGAEGLTAPNLLSRQFTAEQPNQKWVTDVTEFKIRGEKLYLSPVLDLYNGEIVACQIAQRPMFAMVKTMLRKAFRRLAPEDRPLLHSDQGWQYRQPEYRHMLAERGIAQSMSRKANCLDNAVMESFFGTLKAEYFHLNHFDSIKQLEAGLRHYIHYYNHHRIRLQLNGLSPVQYRKQALST